MKLSKPNLKTLPRRFLFWFTAKRIAASFKVFRKLLNFSANHIAKVEQNVQKLATKRDEWIKAHAPTLKPTAQFAETPPSQTSKPSGSEPAS